MKNGGFRSLPRVLDYLLKIDIYDQLEEVMKEQGLPQERLEEFLDLSDAVIDGGLKVEQMPGFIEKAFGVDEGKAKMIATDLAGYRLLPLLEFIPGVDTAIQEWGGKIENYPDLRIAKPGLEDEILEYANEIDLELPEHLMKRFVYLSKSYIEEGRDREGTVTLMKRPMNIGGLEMNDEQIDKLLKILDARFGASEVSSEAEESPQKHVILRDEESTNLKTNEPFTLQGGAGELESVDPSMTQDDTADNVPVISSEVQGEVAAVDSIESGADTSVELKLEEPKADTPATIEDAKEESTETKAETRHRELLPIKAVPHALATDVPVIAGHLFDHEAEEVREHAEKLEQKGLHKNTEYQQSLEEVEKATVQRVVPSFKEAKQPQKYAESLTRAFVRGRLNEQRADALLQDKYGMSSEQAHKILSELKLGYAELHKPQEKREVTTPKVEKKQESRVLDERHAEITSSLPKESITPIMPSARVSAARTKQEEVEGQAKKVDQKKVQEAQRKNKPEKAKVRLSAQSKSPNSQNTKVKVADVKKVEALVGPVQELGTMSIAEFRRMSSDPHEAANKILNILELLEENDYEERVKGVRAWRKNPINALYLQIVHDALEHEMSVADSAAKLRNAGEDSLSSVEIEAIVELNKRMSF